MTSELPPLSISLYFYSALCPSAEAFPLTELVIVCMSQYKHNEAVKVDWWVDLLWWCCNVPVPKSFKNQNWAIYWCILCWQIIHENHLSFTDIITVIQPKSHSTTLPPPQWWGQKQVGYSMSSPCPTWVAGLPGLVTSSYSQKLPFLASSESAIVVFCRSSWPCCASFYKSCTACALHTLNNF